MPNLQSLQLTNINLDFRISGFQLLANAIISKKLKSLAFSGTPITDMNAFQIICNALEGSSIELLKLENLSLYYQRYLPLLIGALPRMAHLKYLNLQGQITLNKTNLIGILENTQIEYLGLRNVQMTDEEGIQLAQKIPLTKLKRLDVSFNFLKLNAKTSLIASSSFRPGLKIYL